MSFIGNLGNMAYIRQTLSSIVKGREVAVAVLASQGISNVPAALLLSGFTQNYRNHRYNQKKGEYLIKFTAVNLLYLAVLTGAYLLIR